MIEQRPRGNNPDGCNEHFRLMEQFDDIVSLFLMVDSEVIWQQIRCFSVFKKSVAIPGSQLS